MQPLPSTAHEFMSWPWSEIAPHVDELLARPLDESTVDAWLKDWATLEGLLSERGSRLNVATTLDTTDAEAEANLNAYLDEILPNAMRANQALKEKLLATGLSPAGFEVRLRNMRADAALFREANVPLATEESKLGQEFDKIIGAQTVMWNGQERTLAQLLPERVSPDRSVREAAWRAVIERGLKDRAALNELWTRFLTLRLQIADNAGMDYRAYRWQEFHRFDYTPDDCLRFHDAIEAAAVPAAARIYERRRQQLGVDTWRPWDGDERIHVDTTGKPSLKPFTDVSQLSDITSRIFAQVDPALGDYYDIMMEERLLDLDNRKGKAPGGYCTTFEVSQRPFIFMNAVGLHDDVQTLLHEGGHSFHAFEMFRELPPEKRWDPPIEFCEVASMSMELLAAPYLDTAHGGFYPAADAARARIEHLEGMITFWPYMAVVDSFQHWVYTHPQEALDPANCDAAWGRQWDRFMKGIDYSGLDDARVTGWHRKLHIFQIPFYYVDYGIAQLGAAQVYANSLTDQAKAVRDYRHALALGSTRPLPALFEAANIRLALDEPTLSGAVTMIETEIERLTPIAAG